MSLSDRIRPGVECAPWVIEEIHKLEAQLAQRSPILTVDVVLLTLDGDTLKVALHRRKQAPLQGFLALPGGYVHVEEDEDMAAAAHRILRDKTGFEPAYLEQLEVFSGPQRDPRGWSASVAFVALVPIERLREERLIDGRQTFSFHDVESLPELAFDHADQIKKAVGRVRNKSAYSTLPCWLLPERFTLAELQAVYEKILGIKLSAATFRARLGVLGELKNESNNASSKNSQDILIETHEVRQGQHRPAKLYRVNHTTLFAKTIF